MASDYPMRWCCQIFMINWFGMILSDLTRNGSRGYHDFMTIATSPSSGTKRIMYFMSWSFIEDVVRSLNFLPMQIKLPVGLELSDKNQTIWVWVNTYRYIFSGMNIHLPAILMFTRCQGFDPLLICAWVKTCWILNCGEWTPKIPILSLVKSLNLLFIC